MRKILLFTVAIIFSGCLNAPQMVEKSQKPVGVSKIENIKVVWVSKKFRYALHQFQSGYGNMQDSIKPTDKVFSYSEVSEKFSLAGIEVAKKLQNHFNENNIPVGEQYILEITPRKASIQFFNGGSTSPSGDYIFMASLKSSNKTAEVWFVKMNIFLLFNEGSKITTTSNKSIDNFASEIIEQMKSDGLVNK